ncbi:MAG: FliM/FliN family flagellar motor switch protein [Puniceicoccales bacterium]|jgi:type III secretion system YscQ/HrcQ family protein|nr:FliM/FliN family flagellar motor switch protein [Puniceicoccales bacterium]
MSDNKENELENADETEENVDSDDSLDGDLGEDDEGDLDTVLFNDKLDPMEEFSGEQSTDVSKQPTKEDSQISTPTIPPVQAKVKRVGKEAVDSLTLDLTFETARKTVTVSELKSIKPGYTFISQNPINSPVEIRANGRLIGYGKLVSVDGNIGVQIMEFV